MTAYYGRRQVGSLCWDRLWDDIISNNERDRGHMNTNKHIGTTRTDFSTLGSGL